ncbi:hypothetical protein [Mesorhizobium cantuariense]|uniref:DUF982 domain-containing protein n=1 Tax=Mesorhizobium cantuariense TaxID=1300275 RepID=A0ABV7MMT2_9HYPH
MTEQIKQHHQFLPVFQEPPDELDADWTHGLLLVGIGQFPQIEWLEAARSYSAVAMHLVDRALSEGVQWDNAHPALFMCRHALEDGYFRLGIDTRQKRACAGPLDRQITARPQSALSSL